jgi:hypothetical protein
MSRHPLAFFEPSSVLELICRLFKEEQTYKDEVTEAEKRLAQLKEDEADGADIRNAVSWLSYSIISPSGVSGVNNSEGTERGARLVVNRRKHI